MAIIEAIHSIEVGRAVYHDNSECTERNNIEARNIRAGKGGKRLCSHCERLDKEDRMKVFSVGKSVQIRSILGIINSRK
jgi:hypothetical protein